MSIGYNVAIEIKRILCRGKYSISELDLKRNVLGDEGIKQIAEGIRKSKTLVHLDISSNDYSKIGGDYLFQSLRDNSTINCLYAGNSKGLHRNFLGGSAVEELNDSLISHRQLVILDLRGASIGNDGLKRISEGLKKCIPLRILNLSFNVITSEASEMVAEIMGKSNIKRLDMSINPLGSTFKNELEASTKARIFLQTHLNFSQCNFEGTGMNVLFDSIRKNTCLTHFALDSCRIVDDELSSLSSYISSHSSLRSLSLNKSDLRNKGIKAIADGLYENSFLQFLYLAKNHISVNFIEYIIREKE